MGPVAMGFGLTRKKVYNHLRWMTGQALSGDFSEEGKLVSEASHPLVAIELTITSASTREYHSMDSRDEQDQRRRCSG